MSYAWQGTTYSSDAYNQGMSGLTDIANKYPDNEAIGGMAIGTMMDGYRTMVQGGLDLNFNKAYSSHLAGLTTQLEGVRTGNQLQLMGAEGRIAKDLLQAQGNQQRLGIAATGKEQRLNIGAQGAQTRLNIGAQGDQDRMSIRETGSEQRKGIVTAGQQERLNIGKRFQEERGMRADARGAIRSLGARFFG